MPSHKPHYFPPFCSKVASERYNQRQKLIRHAKVAQIFRTINSANISSLNSQTCKLLLSDEGSEQGDSRIIVETAFWASARILLITTKH